MFEKPDVRRQTPAGHSLLAVLAHPDDESLACGGLLAWCAAAGAHVTLLCVTHGEHGPTDLVPEPHGTPSVGDIRAAELEDAATILGIDTVTVLDYEDGMLRWVDADQLETDIRDVIRRTAPDVVITFDEDGLYWHPDHIAVHERTTAAVAALEESPPALYYVTMPAGAMRAVVTRAAEVSAARDRHAISPGSILGVEDPDAFGAEAPSPALVVELPRYAALKLRALSCHRSQFHDCALSLIGESDAPRLLGTEHYRRADVGARHDTFIERLAASPTAVAMDSTQT